MSYSRQEETICEDKLKQGFNIAYDRLDSPCELYRQIYNRHFVNSPYFLKLKRWDYEQELRAYVDNPLTALSQGNWKNTRQMQNYENKQLIFSELLNYISKQKLYSVDKLSNEDIEFLDVTYTEYIDLRDNAMREGFASDLEADYLILNLVKLYLDVKYRPQ